MNIKERAESFLNSNGWPNPDSNYEAEMVATLTEFLESFATEQPAQTARYVPAAICPGCDCGLVLKLVVLPSWQYLKCESCHDCFELPTVKLSKRPRD